MTKIARALERKRHAAAGDGCALTGSRRVRRDMNALVGRHASVNGRVPITVRITITVGDNAVPNAQSTLLSEHNSHGGLFLRRFRNAPDAASATTTFLRQRRFCGSDVSAAAAPSAITASFAMVAPSVMATSSASRDYAKHSIMNASVSFSFWHKFAVVNGGFFGTQKALYKRPGQKRGTCQGVQKSPSARRKIVHNRKFVPELPKSGHVFGKAGTKGRSRTKRRQRITQTSGARLPYRRMEE